MPTSPPTLADLAVKAPVWQANTDIRVIEDVLRADPAAPGVLTVLHDVLYLIDRPRFESALSGRLGSVSYTSYRSRLFSFRRR